MLRVVLALWLAIAPALAWAGQSGLLLGIGNPGGTTSTTTFDPSNHGTSQILSNGNLTDSGSGSDGLARSIANHSSGKYYAEFTANHIVNGGLGICNAGANLNTFISGDGTNNAGSAFDGTASWVGGVGGTTTAPGYVIGHVYGVAIDVDNRAGWIKDITAGGNWNANVSANPATNTNGATFTGNLSSGAVYAMASMGNSADVVTANFGATAYAGTPPVGFGNW